jgi:hypothetical protein
MMSIAKQPRNNSALMMYLTDQISRGYDHYLQGEIKVEKIPSFETKMNKKYPFDLRVHQRSYRKRKGLPNYILIISKPLDGDCSWYILAAGTKTKVLKKGAENDDTFRSAKEKNTHLAYRNYEAKCISKPREEGGGYRWSWYLNRREYKQIREVFIDASRSRSLHRLEYLCLLNRKRPMFGGIRGQIKSLFTLAQKEVSRRRKRLNSASQDMPDYLTKTLPFFAKKMTIFE